MRYLFFRPGDRAPVLTNTIESARERAADYIDGEDSDGEPVKKIMLYFLEPVEVISADSPAPACADVPADRQWRALDRVTGIDYAARDKSQAMTVADGPGQFTAQHSDDGGKTWLDAPTEGK